MRSRIVENLRNRLYSLKENRHVSRKNRRTRSLELYRDPNYESIGERVCKSACWWQATLRTRRNARQRKPKNLGEYASGFRRNDTVHRYHTTVVLFSRRREASKIRPIKLQISGCRSAPQFHALRIHRANKRLCRCWDARKSTKLPRNGPRKHVRREGTATSSLRT